MEGGTTVTVRLRAFQRLADGTGFQPGAIVKFGGAAATNVSVLNDTLISAIAPNWILAYDSTLAHADPKSFHLGEPNLPALTFLVTVSSVGEKTNVFVGLYGYVDTTISCYTDCSRYPTDALTAARRDARVRAQPFSSHGNRVR